MSILVPQKVLHLKDELAKKNPKLSGLYQITEKFEGWDTFIYFDGLRFHNPISSAGREIPSLKWVGDILTLNSKWLKKEPFWIRAEAYCEDTPFAILNGLLNKSVGDCYFKDVVFKAHDLIPVNNPPKAIARYELLQEVCKVISYNLIQPVETLYIGNYDEKIWKYYFERVTSEGGEGIVGKRLEGLYMPGKRNSDILKLKLECTKDCLADRMEIGQGEKGNTSYTLVSKRKNGTEIRTVIAKHTDIANYLADPSYFIGRVIQIKAMEEYEDGQLRQATFQHIRHDKLPSEID